MIREEDSLEREGVVMVPRSDLPDEDDMAKLDLTCGSLSFPEI
jgi:hypothetical protein